MLSFKLPLRFLQGVAIVQILVTALVFGLAISGAFSAANASISGVCPDGSIFIVQARSSIPCNDAKEVDPQDIPPLKPGLLPKPYGWQKFHRRQNPNNPYNVVDAAPSLRRTDAVEPELGFATEPPVEGLRVPESEPAVHAAVAPELRAQQSEPSAVPRFSERELRDLALIVELAQRRAPATFGPDADTEHVPMTLRIAHSQSFSPRIRAHFEAQGVQPGGQPVLFTAMASAPHSFYGNLTFVQGATAFHPDRDDPNQLGILSGSLGDVAPNEIVLGYAWLPAGIDLRQQIDIYWNDRLLTTTLDPS